MSSSSPTETGPHRLPAAPKDQGAGDLRILVEDLRRRVELVERRLGAAPQIADVGYEAGCAMAELRAELERLDSEGR